MAAAVLCLACAASQAADEQKFQLVSPELKSDQEIPSKYTCFGGDINPPLEFQNVPPETKSLALTIHSPDAPEGTWVHWVVYNIAPTKTLIAENSVPGYQAFNDSGKYNYFGPCPADEKDHTFVFRGFALKTILEIDEGMTMKDLEKVMRSQILAKSEWTASYRKPIW